MVCECGVCVHVSLRVECVCVCVSLMVGGVLCISVSVCGYCSECSVRMCQCVGQCVGDVCVVLCI